MRKVKLTLAASIMLATTFTFSCSSDDGSDDNSSSSVQQTPSSSSGGQPSSSSVQQTPSSSSGGQTQGSGACLQTIEDMGFGEVKTCIDSPSINISDCNIFNEEMRFEDEPVFELVAKCPDNPNLKCPIPQEELPLASGAFETSMYNPMYNFFTCDELF